MNKKAPAGKIYQCACCGKTSVWRYGFDDNNSNRDENGKYYSSYGWDESCVMNCALVDKEVVPSVKDEIEPTEEYKKELAALMEIIMNYPDEE